VGLHVQQLLLVLLMLPLVLLWQRLLHCAAGRSCGRWLPPHPQLHHHHHQQQQQQQQGQLLALGWLLDRSSCLRPRGQEHLLLLLLLLLHAALPPPLLGAALLVAAPGNPAVSGWFHGAPPCVAGAAVPAAGAAAGPAVGGGCAAAAGPAPAAAEPAPQAWTPHPTHPLAWHPGCQMAACGPRPVLLLLLGAATQHCRHSAASRHPEERLGPRHSQRHPRPGPPHLHYHLLTPHSQLLPAVPPVQWTSWQRHCWRPGVACVVGVLLPRLQCWAAAAAQLLPLLLLLL